MRTFSPKAADVQRRWLLIDAEDLVLGRMATEVATFLRGKHKSIFAPHMDTGDNVIVVNAEKIQVTSNKVDRTFHYRHSGYPGGITQTSLRDELAERPEEVIRRAVKNMLPKGPLGRQMLTKLKVYSGPTHPHHAQSPEAVELPQAKRR